MERIVVVTPRLDAKYLGTIEDVLLDSLYIELLVCQRCILLYDLGRLLAAGGQDVCNGWATVVRCSVREYLKISFHS